MHSVKKCTEMWRIFQLYDLLKYLASTINGQLDHFYFKAIKEENKRLDALLAMKPRVTAEKGEPNLTLN